MTALEQAARVAPRLPGDPTLSVVVTCYNYGHFLEACLESLLAQSAPPDEIVVVNDGSTDGTETVLQAYADRVTAINTPNAGQAAAFNRGFAATSGDLVLFLDADDLLDPIAVETILLHWADDLAALTFGLRTIDGAGRGTGVHMASLHADSGDNRPRLLATGTFRSPPTSGNVFSRRFLAAVLPMPEPRWRISADCYLIRAAALFGRFAHVSQVLGSYRIHGGNNYAIGSAYFVDLERKAENLTDVADALWALAEISGRVTRDPAEASALSTALRRRAAAVLAELAGVRAPATDWPGVPSAVASSETEALLGVARWPVHLPFNRLVGTERSPTGPALEDLIVPDIQELGDHVRNSLVLDFTIDPHPDTVLLGLHLAPHWAAAETGRIVIRLDGTPAWMGELQGACEVKVPLRPRHREIRRPVRVEIRPEQAGGAAPTITGIELATRGPEVLAPFLEAVGWHAPGSLLGAALDPRQWDTDPTGVATLTAPVGHLRFSVPPGESNDLLLGFCGVPPRGSLILSERGRILFNGAIGAARWMLVRLPPVSPPVGRHDIEVRFERDLAEQAALPLRIEAMGLLGHRRMATGPEAPLNLGETVHFGAGRGRSEYLPAGWDVSQPTGARNLRAEALLAFRPHEGAQDLRLVLDLAPVLPALPGCVHVVAVSLKGVFLAAFALQGPGQVEVPIPQTRHGQGLQLVVHSTLRFEPDPETGAAAGVPALEPGATSGVPSAQTPRSLPAVVELRSLSLVGRAEARADTLPMPRAPRQQPPAVQRLLEQAGLILGSGEAATVEDAADLRAEITQLLASCSPAGCNLVAATPRALERLAALGSLTRHVARSGRETAMLEDLALPAAPPGPLGPGSDAKALRRALMGMLHFSACDMPQMADLRGLAPQLFWSIPALADWLARAPDAETAEAHARYVSYLQQLLSSLDHILAREPEETALYRLAAETLMRLRSTRMIFGRGGLRDVIRLRGRCVERLLIRRGAVLPAPRPERPARRKLRIGVLVRDVTATPEGWALLGMYGALDRNRFETTLIRLSTSDEALDTGDIFSHQLCLDGLDLAASVEAIRALDLDMFLTGAYAGEWEKAGWILAHRLAPIQIWPGAVCPSTGGFRSFDLALSARATEPDAPERHYLYPLAWIDGPLQAAYAFPLQARARKAELRKALGLASGRIMLVSGAMAYKIDDALMATWATILARAPLADLVLYPFASNWSMPFAERRFRERLDKALAAAGVDPERVKVLGTQQPEAVQAIVQAADLYLDSFPYTGATTVCEALSGATPVLTLAGDSLRELTGSSWVRAFGLDDMVAASSDAYVARAVALACDPKGLTAIQRRLERKRRAGPSPHCDSDAFGRAFSEALWDIARASGLFRNLGAPGQRDMAVIDRLAPDKSAAPAAVLHITGPAERMAVLSMPRSGSSLLCHMLNATPGVCCHYELFQENMIELYGETVRDPDALARRDADPVGFLRQIYRDGLAGGHRLVGFKHFGFLQKAVLEAVVADRGVRLVVLRRNNLMAKFGSLGVAERTGQWKAGVGEPVEESRIVFDPERFARFERWDNRLNRDLLDLLARHRREALFLEFSELRERETGYRLGQFLGHPLSWDDKVTLRRLNRGRPLDRFANPEDVLGFLEKRGFPEWANDG